MKNKNNQMQSKWATRGKETKHSKENQDITNRAKFSCLLWRQVRNRLNLFFDAQHRANVQQQQQMTTTNKINYNNNNNNMLSAQTPSKTLCQHLNVKYLWILK